MVDRLEAAPDSGFLGYLPAFAGPRSDAAIQYWQSLEDLKRFVRDSDGLHDPAGTWYKRGVDADGGVGSWAELYVVEDGQYATFYRNVHPIGLGAVGAPPGRSSGSAIGPLQTGHPPGRTTLNPIATA